MTTYFPLLIWAVIMFVPLFFLIGRVGMSRLWLVVVLIPIVGGVILLWIISLKSWPKSFVEEVAK